MSKSLEFCKKRASDSSVSTFADRNWGDAKEIASEEVFDEYLYGLRKYRVDGKMGDGSDAYFNVELEFNDDGCYDYFTSSCCTHDGTLLFIHEMMDECVRRALCMGTYNRNAGHPESGDNIKYTIGNFVVLNEYDETAFATSEKPWLQSRTTVLLPLKMIKD